MAYTPPAGFAANFAQTGVSYSAPLGNAANFTFVAAIPTVTVVGAVTLDSIVAVGSVLVGVTEVAIGGAVSLGTISAAGVVAHGVGIIGMPSIGGIHSAGGVAHGVSFSGVPVLANVLASGDVLHPRYSLKGEVRDGGTLVDRTVRVYRRDTGVLICEQATSAGRFDIHAGFEAREHYIVPIHLDSDAIDFSPPTANRVLSVLAMD